MARMGRQEIEKTRSRPATTAARSRQEGAFARNGYGWFVDPRVAAGRPASPLTPDHYHFGSKQG